MSRLFAVQVPRSTSIELRFTVRGHERRLAPPIETATDQRVVCCPCEKNNPADDAGWAANGLELEDERSA
jgi:hypothetical protein